MRSENSLTLARSISPGKNGAFTFHVIWIQTNLFQEKTSRREKIEGVIKSRAHSAPRLYIDLNLNLFRRATFFTLYRRSLWERDKLEFAQSLQKCSFYFFPLCKFFLRLSDAAGTVASSLMHMSANNTRRTMMCIMNIVSPFLWSKIVLLIFPYLIAVELKWWNDKMNFGTQEKPFWTFWVNKWNRSD